MMIYWWIIESIIWLGCLVLNFYFQKKGVPTISQRYHKLLDQKWDYVVMFVFFGLQLYLYFSRILPITLGGDVVVCIIRNIVAGHWFWHED